jgi:hypothetical protein
VVCHRVTDAIAGAVKRAKVPHVVLLSSEGAELDKGTSPIRGLHYFEDVLRKTGAKVTAIRAGMFQENIGNAIGPAKAQGLFFNFMPSADIRMPLSATAGLPRRLPFEKPVSQSSAAHVTTVSHPRYARAAGEAAIKDPREVVQ